MKKPIAVRCGAFVSAGVEACDSQEIGETVESTLLESNRAGAQYNCKATNPSAGKEEGRLELSG